MGERKRREKKITEGIEAVIQIQKTEKMKKRVQLLQLQENQIRSQKVAALAKQDLENSRMEYKGITDTLEFTKLALREVKTALKRTLRSLSKFKVQLEDLKKLVLDQI